MLEYIKTWAAQANIPLSSLKANADQRGEVGDTEGHKSKGMSVRDRAIRLLEGLTDEELQSTAIPKIGRASCRERVCQYVSISVVAVSLKKKQLKNNNSTKQHCKTNIAFK